MLLPFFLVTVNAQSSDEYVGPENCYTCHPVQYNDWNGTRHAQAYIDPVFRETWEEKGKPFECLQCHTTGYDEAAQTFLFGGVTCEVCHGPGEMMNIDTSKELCQQCHTGSRAREIEMGTHGQGGVKCIDCHMKEGGHTFRPTAEACSNCHTASEIHMKNDLPNLRSEASDLQKLLTQLEGNVSKLQILVENQQEELTRSSNGYSYMLYGGIAAAAVVIVIFIGFSIRNRKV